MFNPFEEDAPPDDFFNQEEDNFQEPIPDDIDFSEVVENPTRPAEKRPFEVSQEPEERFEVPDVDEFIDDLSDKENHHQDLFGSEDQSQSNDPAPNKRPRLEPQFSNNLPTLNQIQEINLEEKRRQTQLLHTQMRNKILKTRESNKIQKLIESNSQTHGYDKTFVNLSKVLIVEPINSGFCEIKESDTDTQFYLRKKVEKSKISSLETRNIETIGSNNFYKDFKKLKLSALQVLAARKKLAKKSATEEPIKVPKRNQSSELLVSKFAPNHFTSLLSDTATNRTFLKWMQLWDNCVFGKPKLKKPEPPSEEGDDGYQNGNGGQNFRTRMPQNMKSTAKFHGPQKTFSQSFNNKYSKFNFFDPILEEYNYDSLNRPKHKIILLSGPAGLGKTTLAHIAARHLGYKVQEINSSDDRSAGAMKTMIKKHLSCTDVRNGMTVTGSSSSNSKTASKDGIVRISSLEHEGKSIIKKKPVCLIFDEIDGANSAAIDVIVNLVNNLPKTSKTGSKKSSSGLPVLKTPVIAICNDLYTPSLRSLRNVALVLHVPQLDCGNMIRRLKEIKNADKMLRKLDIPQSVFEYWLFGELNGIFLKFSELSFDRIDPIEKNGFQPTTPRPIQQRRPRSPTRSRHLRQQRLRTRKFRPKNFNPRPIFRFCHRQRRLQS